VANKEIERIHRELLVTVEKRIKELQKLLDEAFAEKERLLWLARENVAGRENGIATLKQLGADLVKYGTEAEVAPSFLCFFYFYFFARFLTPPFAPGPLDCERCPSPGEKTRGPGGHLSSLA
jgi:hypothetical protein